MPGPQADALAIQMLGALNDSIYNSTRYIQWSFRDGSHRYLWDKEMGIAWVQWEENKAKVHFSNPKASVAWNNGEKLQGESRKKLLKTAEDMFNNDSFWLVAPYKVFDEGTQRRLVSWEGEQGLLVTYTSGGSTPGDSYLWFLNDNGFPNSFRMWVNRLPIGGLEASWDDWIVTQTGTFLPKTHKIGPVSLDMGAVETYNRAEDIPTNLW